MTDTSKGAHTTGGWTRGHRLGVGATLLAFAAALSGCTGAIATNSSGSSGSGGITGTIRLASESGQPYIKDAASQFEKLHPGVTVQFVQSPSNTYQTTVRAQLAAGHGPDVMFVWGGSGNSLATKILAKDGIIEDLSSRPWASGLGDAAKNLVSYQGKVYAFTSYQNPTGVVYDKGLLAKLGVSTPTTFSGLLSFCRTVASKGIVPIAMGNQTGYLNTEIPLEIANTLVYSKDPRFAEQISSGAQTWSGSQLWRSALTQAHQQYLQMRDANCFEPNSTGFSDTQAIQLVTSGKALGVDVISPSIDNLKSGNPNLHYDMYEIPATDKPADTFLTTNTGAAWAVAKSSTNKATALAFLDFLAQPDQMDQASKANYGVPYKPAADATVQPEMQGIASLYRANKNALWPTNFWPNPEVKQTMIAEDEDLILGSKNVQQVVDAIQSTLNGS